jgi:hypothetical protein
MLESNHHLQDFRPIYRYVSRLQPFLPLQEIHPGSIMPKDLGIKFFAYPGLTEVQAEMMRAAKVQV